ncbi:MAG: penicillin-binding protein 2, partial [Cytophagales bacterium]|nr:penicillin-binding protein 2 [Cytophagales bacterium]
MNIKKHIVLRVGFVVGLGMISSLCTLYRLLYIQFEEGEKWKHLATRSTQRTINIGATRGDILAQDEQILATSLPHYQIVMDPSIPAPNFLKENINPFTQKLSRYFSARSPEFYKKQIWEARKEHKKYLILRKKSITHQQKKDISRWNFVKEGRLKSGIFFEKMEKRFLPHRFMAYRTIGHVDWKHQGVVGIENSFNQELSGMSTKMFAEPSNGTWYPVQQESKIIHKKGNDVITTLDVGIQEIVEEELLNALMKHRATRGIAIVMEVQTGKIRAIANLSQDPSGKYAERYNYAVGEEGSVEPGSTFKTISMLTLLEKTDVALSDTVNTGVGEWTFYTETMRDARKGGFGVITVQEVFEHSSNIGMAKLITHYFRDRPQEFTDYLKYLRVNEILDFQIRGEAKPSLIEPQDSLWSGTSLPWLAHGYEVKTTPLQLLNFYNAIANEGKMMKPYLVQEIRNKEKRRTKIFQPQVLIPKIASQETLKQIQKLLEGVVKRGTARPIQGSSYGIAGKTGTAKKYESGKYVDQYYTSFLGYFPIHKPKYTAAIIVDEPKGELIHGGDVAAPVFRKIADRIFLLDPELHQNFLTEKKAIEPEEDKIYPVIKAGNIQPILKIS